ncbi:uncharacterized protein CCR75_007859 [Bremia lactucae]|uniref:RanBP2-type domain-containing protein n=1 Tax=Bremia lactucae TaxID=4779 RepID=A0A976IIM2_BRELC|nr:hypothetical protein CCR75_007859 [Bremia lactucae]
MLTDSSSSTTPHECNVRRVKARHLRQESTAPYVKHAKPDEDVEFFYRETAPASHGRRGSGFFARLASYIPIVSKMVTEEEEEEEINLQPAMDENVDVQTTQEDMDEDEAVHEISELEVVAPKEAEIQTQRSHEPQLEKQKDLMQDDKELLDVPEHSVTRTASCFVSPKNQLSTPRRSDSKQKPLNSRSPSRDSRSDSRERSPGFTRQSRKRGEKRVFLPGPSHQSKLLRISTSQRRRKSTSPSPHDSALTIINQKKTITLEEFEQLQKQLHDMVETTPQTQLAMTQAALANGLEHPFTRGFPGPTSFPGYVPGSYSNHGAMVVHDENQSSDGTLQNEAIFGKRHRNQENGPILFPSSALRGQLTREQRLMRKPRPSRLLTGAKRDAAARNAYSAAVAEKILLTLNKVQTPLEREAQKPTHSTSMSWAKYHLSLFDNGKECLTNGEELHSDDAVPPTSTIPRITFPQATNKVDKFETPAKRVGSFQDSVTPLVSPQTVSMTPALTVEASVPKFEKTGKFQFTLPRCTKEDTHNDVDGEDIRLRFVFSPPLALREPPAKVLSYKIKANTGAAAAFSFVPSSPKLQSTEWVSQPVKAKESAMKSVVDKPVALVEAGTTGRVLAVNNCGSVNPLAKFMQLKPGQWKCPGCSVLNEGTNDKCPCCETVKPSASARVKAGLTPPNASHSVSSSDFSFGSSKDAPKVVEKPTGGAITASGFSFGIPTVDKKIADKSAGSAPFSGFSFGVSAADIAKTAEKPALESTKSTNGGFSFTAPIAPIAVLETSSVSTSSSANVSRPSPSISFEFSKPANMVDETALEPSSATMKTVFAPSFSFGVPLASSAPTLTAVSNESTVDASSASINDKSNKAKRKAFETEEPEKHAASPFTCGVSATPTTALKPSNVSASKFEAPKPSDVSTSKFEAPKPSNVSAFKFEPKPSNGAGFNFGAAPGPFQESSANLERPKKRLAPFAAADDLSSESSIQAFAAKSALKPPQVPVKNTTVSILSAPSFSFGGKAGSTNNDKMNESTTSLFSVGGDTSTEKAAKVNLNNTVPLMPEFTFGSSSATPAPKSSGQVVTKAPANSFNSFPANSASAHVPGSSANFSFGQSSTATSTGCAPAFNASPAAPSTSAFENKSSVQLSNASCTLSKSSAPAFTFNSSSPADTTFGLASTSGSAFGKQLSNTSSFGSTSTAFGSSSAFGSGSSSGGFGSSTIAVPAAAAAFASLTPAASAFSIGASSQIAAPGARPAGQPAFSFGASAPSGFGGAPAASSGFGSSAPSGGLNAAHNGFRSSSPAPAFGTQTPSTFSNILPPPTTTFGAPPFGAPAPCGFGSGPAGSGFRTPSPTSAFGAVPASAFTPGPAFGAAPTAGAFGALPSAGAFGAPPADGGFNMGAAPQHARGRRILKAKTRPRRTS